MHRHAGLSAGGDDHTVRGGSNVAAAGRGDDDLVESVGGAGDDTMETAMTPTIERIVNLWRTRRRRLRAH